MYLTVSGSKCPSKWIFISDWPSNMSRWIEKEDNTHFHFTTNFILLFWLAGSFTIVGTRREKKNYNFSITFPTPTRVSGCICSLSMAPPLCFIPASQRHISIMSPYLTVHLHACLSSFVIHHKQVSLLRISGWFTILWYFHRGDEEKMYIGNTSANCSGNPPPIFLFSTLLTGVIAHPPHPPPLLISP